MVIENVDETRSRRDYNRYVVAYDSVLASSSSVVKSAVLLETSYTAVSFQTVLLPVYSYVGDMMQHEAPEFIDTFGLAPFMMKVQEIDRTLVDKVFAVCDYYLSGKVAKHSRHLYDIYKLLSLVSQDDTFKDLIKEVREVRAQSSICFSALPDVDVSGLLKEIIKENVYRKDYENLTIQLLEENISYDMAIEALKKLAESKFFDS